MSVLRRSVRLRTMRFKPFDDGYTSQLFQICLTIRAGPNWGCPMLDNIDRIRECHRHAAHCEALADCSVTQKDSFLDVRERWLALAESYREADRLMRLLPPHGTDQGAARSGHTRGGLTNAEAAAQARQLQALGDIEQIVPRMAHDFSNILTVVSINAHTLATALRDPAQQE